MKITGLIFTSLVISMIYIDFNQPGTNENIQDQTIQFSEELGWINWSHAIPERNIRAFRRFKKLQLTQVDSFNFSFSMDMKIKIKNKFIVASCSNTYRVPVVKSMIAKKELYTEIFGTVSNLLENMQGELPFSLLSGSRASSHRDGDLTGNIISLYSCYTNTSFNEIKNELTLLNIADSKTKNTSKSIDEFKISSYKQVNFLKNKNNLIIFQLQELLSQLQAESNNCRLLNSKKGLTIN